MTWMSLTSDGQVVLISCLIMNILTIISYPITRKRFQKDGPRTMQIDLSSPEVAKMRLTENLQKMKREFKPIKIAEILYISFAFILFLYFWVNDIHGFWMFFVMISGSVVLLPLVAVTAAIKAIEIVLKKLNQ